MRHLWDSGADRYGDGPTAEYAESAEGASVVGIGGNCSSCVRVCQMSEL